MPDEQHPSTPAPTEQQIEQQIARFRKHPRIMGGEVRIAALRWLIDFKRRGRYDRTRNPELTTKQIFSEFYEYSLLKRLSDEVPDTKDAERKLEAIVAREKGLFVGLAHALETYYRGPGASDPIKIELQCGQGGRYEPLIEWRAEPLMASGLHLASGPSGHGVTIYPNWDKFDELLDTVQRDEEQPEDLRIITIAFKSGGAPEDKLVELARRGIRIKVLLTDPAAGESLIRTRNKIRYIYDLETPGLALTALKTQIARLRERKKQVNELKKKQSCNGDLDFYLSDLMPYGFVAHSRGFVVLGLFLATGSYGAGPMIVVDSSANPDLWETLRADWDGRVSHAMKQSPEAADDRQDAVEQIISDVDLISGVEARVPDGTTDIWVAAPDLSNVGDETSPFSELVRKTVRDNASRGINYTYICPKGHAGRSRIENVHKCFPGTPGKLHLYQIPPERFFEITLVHSHFISFNPLAEVPDLYMQLPLSQSQKGWVKLGSQDAKRVLAKMRHLIDEYPSE